MQSSEGQGSVFQCQLLNGAVAPRKAHPHDAGWDLHAAEERWVLGRSSVTVRTGVAVAIPPGHYGRIAPRSGLSVRHSIEVGAGVIDAGYRGELVVKLYNHGDANYLVRAGDRVAQLIVTHIYQGDLEVVAELPGCDGRGAAGFGSSGR